MKINTIFSLAFFLTSSIYSQETIRIPDIGLEEALIDLNIDTNGLNGNILLNEAENVVNLNINDPITNKLLPNVHSKIKDLTGLEHFINLKRLDCLGNKLTKLDLSKNTALTFLNCSENKIESLDLSNNSNLTYVSCDSNKLTSLKLGNKPVLTDVYSSSNRLTSLDVKDCTSLENLDTTGNKITGILVSDTQLNNTPLGWYKDATAVYTINMSNLNIAKEKIAESKTITPQPKVENQQPVSNNQPKESTANYYEKFQFSVVAEYDKLILATTHTQSKKNELQQKYNLDSNQLTQWITEYSNLIVADKNSIKTINENIPKKSTASHYSKFKKAAIDEYEKLILNPAYLQSKKEEIQRKYNLNSEQFTQWIIQFGTPSLKAKTTHSQESTKSYYERFKKSVVDEYDSLVLNTVYVRSKKKEIQQKYNLTASQLNESITKYSRVRKH